MDYYFRFVVRIRTLHYTEANEIDHGQVPATPPTNEMSRFVRVLFYTSYTEAESRIGL